jgi:hypothetical protein
MSCTPGFFAQAGSVTVTQADQDPNMGSMVATVTNLTLVAWDFSQGGDKPIAGGQCYVIGSASFNVSWGGGSDGGTSGSDGSVPTDDASVGGSDASVTPDLAVSGSDAGTTTVDLASAAPDLTGGMTSSDGGAGCTPVVNEIMTTGTKASDEFVEIYNPCTAAVDLTGWSLGYRSAANNAGPALYVFTQKLAAGSYLVIAGAGFVGPSDGNFKSGGLAQTGGAVALLDPTGAVADSVAWKTLSATNTYTESMPAPNPPAGQSISRLPNGHDTNDNSADFQVTAITPGAANM